VLPAAGESNRMSSQLLEEASKIIPNTALLVNLVSKRVRQLTMGHRPLVEVGPRMSNADVALKEIIDGKLTFEFQNAPSDKV
jgi:DNA-directed RNA polymerase subunit omega